MEADRQGSCFQLQDDYLSVRLLHHAMRILLVNEFMRRLECIVKSSITQHTVGTRHRHLVKHQDATAHTARFVYDTPWTYDGIFPPLWKWETMYPNRTTTISILHLSRLSSLCKQSPSAFFLRTVPIRCRDCTLHLSILCNRLSRRFSP